MKNILKVYAGKKDIAAIREAARIIESYDAFILVEADEKTSRSLARKFPVEDITAQYELSFGDRRIVTSQPRISSTGSTRPHAAYRSERPLKPGPHHYMVQFIGPIKQNWLMRIRATGAKLREPRGNFCIRNLGQRANGAQGRRNALRTMARSSSLQGQDRPTGSGKAYRP
jgi:serine protease AprX